MNRVNSLRGNNQISVIHVDKNVCNFSYYNYSIRKD